jgi:REP element-mobilizing transposase RayT
MPHNFKHKNIRLPPEQYRGQKCHFVTACFDTRRSYGTRPALAPWLIASLGEHAAAKGFLIHAYSVMPDHLHFLAEGVNKDSRLLDFVASFKKETGYQFEGRKKRRLWQFKYYDHILRSGADMQAVCWYIWMNPVRAGICRAPAEHAFSGSFTEWGASLLKAAPVAGWTPPWKI